MNNARRTLVAFGAMVALTLPIAATAQDESATIETVEDAQTEATHTVTIRIEGMTCQGCVQTASKEILGIDGVIDASVELESGLATVTCSDSLQAESVVKALQKAGKKMKWKVTEVTADAATVDGF
jgi:copper chaperone CopZ